MKPVPKTTDGIFDEIPTIICAYNESDNIFNLVSCLKNLRYDRRKIGVIVINDGSSDNTADLARKAGAKMVITLTKNYGKATAFFYGLRHVLRSFSSDFLLSFDGDVKEIDCRQVAMLLDPFLDPSIKMTIGSVEGISDTSVLSGQRGYLISSIRKLVDDPHFATVLSSTSKKRIGYGIELLLNHIVTGLPELLFPIDPKLGVQLVNTNIQCTTGWNESKYPNKLKADKELAVTQQFIE